MALQAVTVPDIGDFKDVPILEILVKAGDSITVDQSLITLESDKATMEIPSSQAGIVQDIKVAIGDKVSAGSVILILDTTTEMAAALSVVEPGKVATVSSLPSSPTALAPGSTDSSRSVPSATSSIMTDLRRPKNLPPPPLQPITDQPFTKPHAGPAVRHLARELGVDLNKVKGSGRHQRILKADVHNFVKQVMNEGSIPGLAVPLTGGGMGIPEIPAIDFSKFGDIEIQPLSRIQKLSGASLHRSWLNIPHVTQFDQADITELEQFRRDLAAEGEKRQLKVTLLSLLLKACAAALKEFPTFNASLDSNKENLILKKYYHLGVAVDTPDGLVVPVITNVDKKGLFELATDLRDLSQKARDKKLSPQEMQGACFTISSLGGIGGTAFTPIINAPEVAILGVSRAQMQPVYQNEEFVPRLILPLSLSYDHRVIDGALAARFTQYLRFILSDIRRLLL
jgi:pyruvate dehydrogenase E2 component (dihydrolipoamide acetyltransferase)